MRLVRPLRFPPRSGAGIALFTALALVSAVLTGAAAPARAAAAPHRPAIEPRITGGVANGTFETGTLSGWTASGKALIQATGAHSGTYAANVGSNVLGSTSTLAQTFTQPTDNTAVSFWYDMTVCTRSANGTTFDYTTATLKDNTASTTATVLPKICASSNTGWQQVTATAVAGHSYTLTFTTFTTIPDSTSTLFDDAGTLGITFAKTADQAATQPGSTVHYTITVSNVGQLAYTGAGFSDSLAATVDDAAYNNDAAATAGSVAYTAPNLTWTGNLAVGATATVTYSATVSVAFSGTATNQASGLCMNDPNPSTLATQLNQLACTGGSAQSWTFTPVSGLPASYAVASSAGQCLNISGFGLTDNTALIHYTCNGQGNEQFALHPVSGSARTYNLMAGNSGKCVQPASGSTASGALLVQVTCSSATAQIWTLSGIGDKTMADTITSGTTGNNCPVGGTDGRCGVSIPVQVPWVQIAKTANVSSTAPGSTIGYTITVTNSGQLAYTGASLSDSLSAALDDAAYNNNASATAGTVAYTAPNLTWTGNLAVGASVTITYSMTVSSPDNGDRYITDTITSSVNGNDCFPYSSDPRCAVTVLDPGPLSVTVPTGTNLGSIGPGHTISAALGSVTVTDQRLLSGGGWTATVSATGFKTGGGTGPETIGAGYISYWSGPATASSGTATLAPGQPTAAAAQSLAAARTSFSSSAGAGITSATWRPTLAVSVPPSAVAGTYTATLTYSVA
jgi:uncharacterized repeat protein (TIGR01451 family)